MGGLYKKNFNAGTISCIGLFGLIGFSLVILGVVSANIPPVFRNEGRPGGVIFLEEAFFPTLTNLMDINTFQQWAVELIARYNSGDLVGGEKAAYYSYGDLTVFEEHIPSELRRLHTEVPAVRFTYKNDGMIKKLFPWYMAPMRSPAEIAFALDEHGKAKCVTFSWYLYGIWVGEKSFVPPWEPWFVKKIQNGVYLYFVEK